MHVISNESYISSGLKDRNHLINAFIYLNKQLYFYKNAKVMGQSLNVVEDYVGLRQQPKRHKTHIS